MHPHVKFFDKLASRMAKKDEHVSRLLCGIRDQVDAAEKARQAGRVRLGNRKSYDSVLKSVTKLMDKHGEAYPEMRSVLSKFVQKVTKNESLV